MVSFYDLLTLVTYNFNDDGITMFKCNVSIFAFCFVFNYSVWAVDDQEKTAYVEPEKTFKITPLYPVDELRAAARVAKPPVEARRFLTPDLVELTTLDESIHLDIRYASENNFMGASFYSAPRAFLQRPAAEALVRVHHKLKKQGFGFLVHDAYRPWYVTKMFWDATPDDKKMFVANPQEGSRHNRGCAVDLTLYHLKTGKVVRMVSGYDEMSDRSHIDYPGGTSQQRKHRSMLREAMESEGFSVELIEWWHYDYKTWSQYPILNKTFDEI